MTWGYVWNRLENDADSKVKGRIGVAPLPHDQGGKSATCIGGWQLAVSAYSKNKAEAVKFVRYLSSPEVSKMQAIMGVSAAYRDVVLGSWATDPRHPTYAGAGCVKNACRM